MNSDRLGQMISHDCEWQLRELAAYMGALLDLGRADDERNPLRAEIVGAALYRGIEAISGERDEPPHPRPRARPGGGRRRCPSATPRSCAMLQERGVQPVRLTVRTVEGPGNQLRRANSGYASLPRDGRISTRSGHGELERRPDRAATWTCSPRTGARWRRRSRPPEAADSVRAAAAGDARRHAVAARGDAAPTSS